MIFLPIGRYSEAAIDDLSKCCPASRIADIAEGPNRANNVKEVADIVGVAEATVNAHVLCAQETGRPGRDGR